MGLGLMQVKPVRAASYIELYIHSFTIAIIPGFFTITTMYIKQEIQIEKLRKRYLKNQFGLSFTDEYRFFDVE